MTRELFTLQPSDVPQPRLLDEEIVTDAPWPMPPARAWEPAPRLTWWQRAREFVHDMLNPEVHL